MGAFRSAVAEGSIRRAAAGTTLGLVLVAALIAGIAARAQHLAVVAGRMDGYPVYLYSLPGHVLAMLLLAGLTVLVATSLSARRGTWMALIVVVGVVLGPMELVAAPVRADLVSGTDANTVLSWRLVVAVPIALLLATITWWNVRCLRESLHEKEIRPAFERNPWLPASGSVFATVAAGSLVVQLAFGYSANAYSGGQKPGLLPVLGWAVLTGGIAVLMIGRDVGWKVPASLLLGSAAVPGSMFLAYDRDGGWPGVAGWEFNGMESPIVLSSTAALILLAPALAGLLWFTRSALTPGRRSGPARRSPQSPDADARVATPG